MKAISTGSSYMIYDDSLQVYDSLPAQAYKVAFSKNQGFFLEKYQEPDPRENKIYGDHTDKVNKVMNAFARANRNLGVILSGAKGIGKTLFAKLLGLEAINKGLPLLVVDRYIPGIGSYLESIEQECMVFFDEFDKTFGDVKRMDGAADPQTEMLTLFDGIVSGKKLFVITCNGTRNLSDYLVNRPGRFHYHFRFEYPNAKEIEIYLKDKIPEAMFGEIHEVTNFALRVPLNYDCLRAIAFELSGGSTFKEAISILNIINVENARYTVRVHFNNGFNINCGTRCLDMFNANGEMTEVYSKSNEYLFTANFQPNEAVYNATTGTMFIDGENVNMQDIVDDPDDVCKAAMDSGIHHIEFKRILDPSIHYKV